MTKQKITPLMQQFFSIKEQHPQTLLFFQVGDFYELFFDDAVTAASYLAIALTKRGKNNGEDIPLCGVPVHALDHYLIKLIKGGFKVAICDQITQPQPGKVVERAVTRVLTPGTLTDSSMLDATSASYLFSLYPGKESWGLVFSEILTAQLFVTTIPAGDVRMLEAELIRFLPDEIIVPELKKHDPLTTYFRQMGYTVSQADGDSVGTPVARAWVDAQFTHQCGEIQEHEAVDASLHIFHSYLQRNQSTSLEQFKHLSFYEPADYLILDGATQRNLEIVKNCRDGGKSQTLLSILDGARTAMGSRTIRKWLLRPLVGHGAIEQRHEVVGSFLANITTIQRLDEHLSGIADLERITGRIGLGRATLHDFSSLRNSLTILPELRSILKQHESCSLVPVMLSKIIDFSPLIQLLESSLETELGGALTIRAGFDKQLDEIRDLLNNGRNAILQFERAQVDRTGIGSLKVGFNQVSGYYIEVTNPNLSKVPDDYKQYQKLSNRQRFVTDDLRTLEHKLTHAKTQHQAVEKQVYERVKSEVVTYLSPLRQLAQTLAYLDGLFGFARVAYNNSYVRPKMSGDAITIEKGRHPVVEYALGGRFIANDTRLDEEQSLLVVTGPNMGGKSTYLRQVALIQIMAQSGSFVPADAATLPILDRIFTRIGAGDDLSQGKSTFLVEMEETAVICTQATKQSLVILDEVGRGTSTYDGMALAQAIVEHLYANVGSKALFATHYHELTDLAEHHKGIHNYFLKSQKTKDGIVFLHEVAPGIAQASFGLEVAKLAQLPAAVVARAGQILQELHAQPRAQVQPATRAESCEHSSELDQLKTELARLKAHLEGIDLDNLTPRKAFDLVWELKKG